MTEDAGLMIPCMASRAQLEDAKYAFVRRIHTALQTRLKHLGIRPEDIAVADDRARPHLLFVAMYLGDGTPVKVRVTLGELQALDPLGTQGMGTTFVDACADRIYAALLKEAGHVCGKEEQDPDHVKAGIVGHDGLCGLHLGPELQHVLGDAAYDLDAEIKGLQTPSSQIVSNLNPASSTPGRFDRVIGETIAEERERNR